MRFVWFLLLAAFQPLSAQDPIEVFQGLAYTRDLPTKSSVKAASLGLAAFRLLRTDQTGDTPIDWAYSLSGTEGFRVEIAAQAEVFIYILLDDPKAAEPAIRFPTGTEVNLVKPEHPQRFPDSKSWTLPAAVAGVRLLLAASKKPIRSFPQMSIPEARAYLQKASAAGELQFEEKRINAAPR